MTYLLVLIVVILFTCVCSMHFNLRKAAEIRANDLIELAKQDNELIEMRHNLAEHQRLHAELNQILHPNGDGPKAPSLCDLVAYVGTDLRKAYQTGFIDAVNGLSEFADEIAARKISPDTVRGSVDHIAARLEQIAQHHAFEYVNGNKNPVTGL